MSTGRRSAGVAVVAVVLSVAWVVIPAPTAAVTVAAVPSDFNGDGYADLAVGVPGESVGAAGRSAGAVNVIYGSASGPRSSGDQLWSLDSAGIKGTSHGRQNTHDKVGDRYGSALASGDFDRDGYADLAVGIMNGRLPHKTRSVGTVSVLYGSKAGLTAANDQLWSQANLPGTPEQNDSFGNALASGDFDGDGFWDLAIGVIGDDVGQLGNEGSAEVIYGGPKRLTATRAHVLTRSLTGASDASVAFGAALAAGDLNGDGRDDLAVGAPTCDWIAHGVCPIGPGDVSVFYGTAGGLGAAGSQLWSQASPGIEDEPEPDDSFGFSLAIGDFNGDAYGDLAAGVPSESVSPCPTADPAACIAGAVAVLYGGTTGLTSSGNQLWHVEVPGVPGEIDEDLFAQDLFGFAIASGDLNGDGRDDLAISDPWARFSTLYNAGSVVVLYGSIAGIAIDGAQRWTQDSPGIPDVPNDTDLFGYGVAIGNYGGSGQDDLAIGAEFEDFPGARNAGMVNVVFGGTDGLSGAGAQAWSQGTPGVRESPERGDEFGKALTP